MSIAIDVREACLPRPTGKGRFTERFVLELSNSIPSLILYTRHPIPDRWELPSSIRIIHIPVGGLFWHIWTAISVCCSKDIQLYVSPTSYITPCLIGWWKPVVSFVHDLIAFQSDPHHLKARIIEHLTLGLALRASSHVCTLSDSTKHDLLHYASCTKPNSITCISSGPVQDGDGVSDAKKSHILCVGTLCPRKNQLRLLEAFAQLPLLVQQKHALILVGGRGWHDADIIERIDQLPTARWLNYVSDDELDHLYNEAVILACPFLYEGFGLPVLTGFQRGIPVLTSNRGSLQEVAGDSAYIVDPESVDSIRDGLETLLNDDSLRQQYRQKGVKQASLFTWKRTIERFIDIPPVRAILKPV